MEAKTCVVLLALVAAAAVADAQRNGRNRGGKPRGPPQLPDGDVYSWARNVSGSSVDESAFVPTGSNLIIMRSFDEGLRGLNLSRASILYDFSTPSPLVAIGSFGPCFITNTNLTYQDVIDELDARNGSSASTTAEFRLDGTSLPLPLEQVRPLYDNYPSLRRACRDGRVIMTTPDVGNAVPFETEDLTILVVDGTVAIRIPKRIPRAPRPIGGFTNPSQNRFGPRVQGRRPGQDLFTTGTQTPSQETSTTSTTTTTTANANPPPSV
ncbi:hypothetical protein Bpfe_026662 [Biomphalaria pfeifferi]|uniref:Uncharacterized protein n=1 Tax=Biomphalaria pfeifferi TaxID=112525 RepID=A0AAD8AWV5_BIOPF|nr:hypothetical protein Bpfe_026662 [Biomphalaria pfeifferi]